jgi:hypothetical protein
MTAEKQGAEELMTESLGHDPVAILHRKFLKPERYHAHQLALLK